MISDHDIEDHIEPEDLDCSYLITEDDLKGYTVRLIKGDKAGSTWLVVDDQFIFHKNDSSVEGDQVYWECARRKQARYGHFQNSVFHSNPWP